MTIKGRFVSVTSVSEMSHQCGIVQGPPPNPTPTPPPPSGPFLWIAGQSCEVLAFLPTARNNDAPSINIQGALTNLTGPLGNDFSESYAVALDTAKKIYVIGGYNTVDTSTWVNNVCVFDAGANGNVAPVQFISGNLTQLGVDTLLSGICVDGSSNIYVGISTTLLKFAAGANGNVAPTVLVTLTNERFTSLFFDTANQLIWALTVSEALGVDSAIRSYGLDGTLHTYIHGGSTTLDAADYGFHQICLTSDGTIYLAGISGVTFKPLVTVFAAGANGNVAPSRTFGDTIFGGYNGIAIDGSGNAYMSGSFSTLTPSRQIEIMPASSSGGTSPTGAMTNSALYLLDDGAGTSPLQLFFGG